jgi:alkylhydroperoxidase family enzyme
MNTEPMRTEPITADAGFLRAADPSPEVDRLFADDREQFGYVMNLSRPWAHLPEAHESLFALMRDAAGRAGLSFRQRAILVASFAGVLGDPHCSLAWGTRLAGEAGDEVAAAVLRGDDSGLEPADRALARWARQLARDPNGTGTADVQALRDAGFDDTRIAAITLYVALRIAYSTVNDGLGARPDRPLRAAAPEPVREMVTYGRPTADEEP